MKLFFVSFHPFFPIQVAIGSHPRIQQLQNPNIDDKTAWLHWTFCNAVAPTSGDPGMGCQEVKVPEEKDSILNQSNILCFCV